MKLHLKILIIILGLVYFAEIFSPPRLTNDSITYLQIAEHFTEGGKGALQNSQTQFPLGYPIILSFLLKAGVLSSALIIFINVTAVLLGLYFIYRCFIIQNFTSRKSIAYSLIFFLLSWIVVKHTPLILSDSIFFALSSAVIMLLAQYREKKRLSTLIASIFLTIISIPIRTAGVALLPVILFTTTGENFFSQKLWRGIFFKPTILLSFFILFFGIVGIVLLTSGYFTLVYSAIQSNGGIFSYPTLTVSYKLRELGEIFINIPSSRIPQSLSIVFSMFGACFFVIIMRYLIKKWPYFLISDFYIISYLLILFIYPFYDPRFWIPALPFLLYIIFNYFEHYPLFLQRSYIALFVTTGVLWLLVSLGITFSNTLFLKMYGDGTLSDTYRYYFDDSASASNVQWDILKYLKKLQN